MFSPVLNTENLILFFSFICSIFTILLSIFLVVSIKDKNKFTFNFDFFKKGESNNLIYNESFDDINKNVNIKVSSSNIYIKNSFKDDSRICTYENNLLGQKFPLLYESDGNVNIKRITI